MNERRIRNVFIYAVGIFAACVLAVTALFWHFGTTVEKNMAEKFNAQQSLLADQIKNHVIDKIKSLDVYLQTLKNEEGVNTIVRRMTDGNWQHPETDIDRFYASHMKPIFDIHPHFIRLAVIDADGRAAFYAENVKAAIRLVYMGTPNPELTQPFSIPAPPPPDGISISRPHAIKAGEQGHIVEYQVLDASVPLYRNGNNTLAGWLVISVSIDAITDILATGGKGGTDHRWLFDEDGNLVYCSLIPSQAFHQMEIDALRKLQPDSFKIIDARLDSMKDILSHTPLLVGENRWTLVVESSFDEVSGLVRNLNRIRTVTIALLALIAIIGGFVLYRTMMGRFIAEEKGRLLDKLSESEEKFRLLFELAPDPIFVLDHERKVLSLNPRAVNLLKYSRLKLNGTPLEKMVPEKGEFNDMLDTLLTPGDSRSWEHTMIDGHGKTLHFYNTTTLLKPEEDRMFYQTYLHDITERIEFEKKLTMEKKNLGNIVSSLGAGLALYSNSRELKWFNERFDEVCDDAELGPHQCCLGDRRNNFVKERDCCVTKTINTGKTHKDEMKIVTASGEAKFYNVTTTPVFDDDEKVAQVIELVVDVTESKRLEAKLSQNDKLSSLGELAAGIAHELNNPMTAIIGYAEFLIEHLHDKEMEKDADRIHSEAVRCAKIVENLLAFSRQQERQRQPVEVEAALDRTIEIVRHELKVSEIEVEKECEPQKSTIMGDVNELQQVFLNIINNATFFLKQSPAPRKIWLSIRNTANGMQTSIENNGPKINEKIINKVFDPFYTTKEVGKGTGLGLSISHGIVKSHRGDIQVYNTERGVQFAIDLPKSGE